MIMKIIRPKVSFQSRLLNLINGVMQIWRLKHSFRKTCNLEVFTTQIAVSKKKVKNQKLMEVLKVKQKTASIFHFSWTS